MAMTTTLNNVVGILATLLYVAIHLFTPIAAIMKFEYCVYLNAKKQCFGAELGFVNEIHKYIFSNQHIENP
jgi:hypothetical protein